MHRRLKSLKIEHTVIENIPDNSSYLCGLNITCPDLEVNIFLIVDSEQGTEYIGYYLLMDH